MENHHLDWIVPLKFVIFHSYVKSPEGTTIHVRQNGRFTIFKYPNIQINIDDMGCMLLISMMFYPENNIDPSNCWGWKIIQFPLKIGDFRVYVNFPDGTLWSINSSPLKMAQSKVRYCFPKKIAGWIFPVRFFFFL